MHCTSTLRKMIATPQAFTPSLQPSRTVTRAAQNAAASQHAQINLIRLVKSLDKADPMSDEGTAITRRKDWEVCFVVVYVRCG